jgi:hypothetical protein
MNHVSVGWTLEHTKQEMLLYKEFMSCAHVLCAIGACDRIGNPATGALHIAEGLCLDMTVTCCNILNAHTTGHCLEQWSSAWGT